LHWLLRELGIDAEDMLASIYSCAAAYVAISYAVNNDHQEIYVYLLLSDSSLLSRVRLADDSVRVQPSLFDRVERISEEFMPSLSWTLSIFVTVRKSGNPIDAV
jgi:hypothetical protein